MQSDISDALRNCIGCFLRDTNASIARDNEMIADILALATREYAAISSSDLRPIVLDAFKSVFIGNLRLGPTNVFVKIMEEIDGSLLEKVTARVEKLKRHLLAFQPAIFKPIKNHFVKEGAIQVDFSAKTAGRQIGTVAMVAYEDGRKDRQYFVKSNRNFQVPSDSFAHITSDIVHNVDYKELFVYRVLDQLKLGPAVKFIIPLNSESGLLIASLDLSHYDGDQPPIKFTPFVALHTPLYEQLIQQGLQGNQLTAALDSAQAELFSSPVAQHDLKMIDLLCNIMHLEDVLVNWGNFGQIIHADLHTEIGWKLVDFTVALKGLRTVTDSYVVYNIGAQFRKVYRYSDTPVLREALLSSDDLCDSIKSEILLGRDGVPGLEAILRTTVDEIRHLMESHSTTLRLKEDLHNKKMLDLAVYAEAVMVNLLDV